ncbi:MAG: serine/threonine protein kinase [Deltaproteobacteria bacterium]|nr:serine/threonine protein kinase [Deltaproteobacteria bacterium]
MVGIDIGSTLGPYRLVAELGEGGMARLFLGLRTMADGSTREAAIKVIRPEHLRDEAFIEMFLDEGRIASFVNSPQVVRITEVGEVGGTYFMAMEFLHAVTLATFLKELYRLDRRPSPEVAVAICTRVAEGLHAAHETRDESGRLLDVVHRDVSPSNILLGCSGSVKLIDFGIAKAQGRLHKTSYGRTKGKLRYMAPEQMRRNDVDKRADIWSLGVVLWETLATRRLYGSSGDLDVVRTALEGGLQPPGAYADVPFAIDRAVMRCLQVDREKRPPTAGEAAAILRESSPEAAAIRDQELSSLVWAVCGHVLDNRARSLPIELPTRKTLTTLEPKPAVALQKFSEFLDEADDATVVGELSEDDLASIGAKSMSLAPPSPEDHKITRRAIPGGAEQPTAGAIPSSKGAAATIIDGTPPPGPAAPVPMPARTRVDTAGGLRPAVTPKKKPLPLWLLLALAIGGAVLTGVLSYALVRYL